MSDKKELEKPAADPELDELLDSALEDFSKKLDLNESQANRSESKKDKSEGVEGEGGGADDAEWTDEFIKQAAAQFETNMSSLLGSIPGSDSTNISSESIQQNFQRMAEAAAQAMSNPQALQPTPQSNDFAATITQTLQGLSLGAENLQNPFSEQDIISMFGGGGVGGGGGDANTFLPFMQGMMQSLLSKEVLYPSLKDILVKYPAWLDENKNKLDHTEFQRYTKQQELMKDVCEELEKEQESDSESVKRERFDKVLALMQKMQDLGQPPTELVGEMGPGLQFDGQGNPILPQDINMADPNQCSLM